MDPDNLTLAFGMWAAVVGMIGVAIVWELARLRGEVRSMSAQLGAHMMQTEHRVTAIEAHLARDGQFVPRNHFGVG